MRGHQLTVPPPAPSADIWRKAPRTVSRLPLSAICISILSRSTGAVAVRLTAPAMPAAAFSPLIYTLKTCISVLSWSAGAVAVRLTAPAMPAMM